jgi:3-hydroxy-3-methylglutaryl CoA synthase
VGEFFSGIVGEGYHQGCNSQAHQAIIDQRQPINFSTYLTFYTQSGWLDKRDQLTIPVTTTGKFRLSGIQDHKRLYALNPSAINPALSPAVKHVDQQSTC